MSDRALLRAILTWGRGDLSSIASRFSESWRERLAMSRPVLAGESPDDAWSALRSDHRESSRPDPSRVHPSWFVRALKSESTAVRLAVTAHAPEPIREILRKGLRLSDADLASDREPDSEAVGWALGLWSERLVGDVTALDSDPPVVVALTRFGLGQIVRLVKVCGLVKHACVVEGNGLRGLDESQLRFTAFDRVRLGFFKRHIGAADPRIMALARQDFRIIQGDRRRGHARLGLVTLGRLLQVVEPHRARWAVQHWPYPIARFLRSQTNPAELSRSMLSWEAWVLEVAWCRLHHESRLPRWKAPRPQGAAEVLP